MLRRSLLIAAAGTPLIRPAFAQPVPNEVRAVVGFGAGGGTDQLARRMQQPFEKRGRRLVVENLPGGGSAIAMTRVSQSRPDGSTIGIATSGLLALMAGGEIRLGPADFTPLVRISEDPFMLAVGANSPITDARAAIAKLRTPQGMTIGSGGTHGGLGHIALAGLVTAAGGNFVHVGYPGTAKLVTELVGGHVEAGIFKPNDVLGQVRAGAVRPLGVFTEARMPQMPDTPTFKELGLDVFPYGRILQMTYVVGPPRMPAETKAAMVAMLREITLSEEAQAAALSQGYTADALAGPELAAAIEGTIATIRDVQPRLGAG